MICVNSWLSLDEFKQKNEEVLNLTPRFKKGMISIEIVKPATAIKAAKGRNQQSTMQ